MESQQLRLPIAREIFYNKWNQKNWDYLSQGKLFTTNGIKTIEITYRKENCLKQIYTNLRVTLVQGHISNKKEADNNQSSLRHTQAKLYDEMHLYSFPW
jgi:hypothetical protein